MFFRKAHELAPQWYLALYIKYHPYLTPGTG